MHIKYSLLSLLMMTAYLARAMEDTQHIYYDAEKNEIVGHVRVVGLKNQKEMKLRWALETNSYIWEILTDGPRSDLQEQQALIRKMGEFRLVMPPEGRTYQYKAPEEKKRYKLRNQTTQSK